MKPHILTCAALAAVPAMIAPAVAAAPAPVYPVPQQCEISKNYLRPTAVTVQTRTADSKGALWDRLPADIEGAYAVQLLPNGHLTVCANDEHGLYYAKQTLLQLLRDSAESRTAHADPVPEEGVEAVADMGELPMGTIIDWPDIKYRGAVEGYYGIPWSYEGRQSLFRFMGRNKMNLYIYAPKDDPLHHGEGCYKPYEGAKAMELASLVQCAKENHVRFVWAIHPANTVKWDENGGKTQLDGLCDKLQKMYDLGLRDFGVLVDDSFGEIGKPERQVELCNYILNNFIRKHPDVNQELIMCPTGYNRSWTNEDFLKTLGDGLDKDIHVMWTGNTVVNDITLPGQQWVMEKLGRPTFIWWNWPCNDMKPSRLSMGRTYGLGQEPEIKATMSGFVANPMERAEANKVALFGVGDYTWNIGAFDSETSWREGIKRLYPQCTHAMQCFCDHNSDLLPNNHGYAREESVEIQELVDRFRDSIAQGVPDPETADAMQKEFERVARAGENLQRARGMKALQLEIAPWLERFRLTGQAGVNAIRAMKRDDLKQRMNIMFDVVRDLDAMNELTRDMWNRGKIIEQSDIQVGARAITPAMQSAFKYLNANVYSQLSGTDYHSLMPKFSTSYHDSEQDTAGIQDGDLSTYWHSGRRQKEGDWFCLDLGAPTAVRTINLVMGNAKKKEDFPAAGQMEFSVDGETWEPIGDQSIGARVPVDLNATPVKARMVRYRITQPNEKWTAITEFTVNRPLPAMLSTTVADLKNISAYDDEDSINLVRVPEVKDAAPGSHITMRLPRPVKGTGVIINMDDEHLDQWARIELTLVDGSVVTPKASMQKGSLVVKEADMPAKRIRQIRMVNADKATHQIRLTEFSLKMPPLDPETDMNNLRDRDFSTAYNCGKAALEMPIAVPADATQVVIIGRAQTTVDGATHVSTDDRIQVYAITPGTKVITVKAARQFGRHLYEVIFR